MSDFPDEGSWKFSGISRSIAETIATTEPVRCPASEEEEREAIDSAGSGLTPIHTELFLWVWCMKSIRSRPVPRSIHRGAGLLRFSPQKEPQP